MARESLTAAVFTVDIPDEIITRLQAVLSPTPVDAALIVRIVKRYLGELELRAFQQLSLRQHEMNVKLKVDELNRDLGLNELP